MKFSKRTIKNILTVAVILFTIFMVFRLTGENSKKENNYLENKEIENDKTTNQEISDDFIKCLEDAGVVIYGSEWCPACTALVESLGGYQKVDSIYVECTIEEERCSEEMKTEFVPEIQIKGELFESGVIPPEVIGNKVGCEL